MFLINLPKKRIRTGGETVNLSQPVNHTGLKSGKRLTRAKKGQKVDSGLEIWGWSVYMDPKSQPFWDSIGQKVDSGQKKWVDQFTWPQKVNLFGAQQGKRLTRARKIRLVSLHGPKKSTFLGLNRAKG